MTLNVRGMLVWPAMILAGLALAAYVVVAWPATAAQDPQPVPLIAASYPEELFVHEVSPAPLLDAFISAPQAVDAN